MKLSERAGDSFLQPSVKINNNGALIPTPKQLYSILLNSIFLVLVIF